MIRLLPRCTRTDTLVPYTTLFLSTGYCGCIAAEDDTLVFQALTSTAESWLRARNMRRVHGPFNLSINEELGLLVDGFDTPPMLLMGHDLPYVGKRLEEQGYKREKDVLAYLYDTEQDMPVAVRRLIDRPQIGRAHV